MIPGLSETDSELEEYLSSIKNSQIQIIGPELIFGTLYDRMGYSALDNEMFRHLVVCRLYNPGSKLKTVDYLSGYLHVTYSVDRIYRFLDELCLRHEHKTGDCDNANQALCDSVDGKAISPSVSSAEREGTGLKEQVERITFAHTRQVVGG
jgi:hypothetical protein